MKRQTSTSLLTASMSPEFCLWVSGGPSDIRHTEDYAAAATSYLPTSDLPIHVPNLTSHFIRSKVTNLQQGACHSGQDNAKSHNTTLLPESVNELLSPQITSFLQISKSLLLVIHYLLVLVQHSEETKTVRSGMRRNANTAGSYMPSPLFQDIHFVTPLFSVLGIQLRALCTPGRCSTIESSPTPQPPLLKPTVFTCPHSLSPLLDWMDLTFKVFFLVSYIVSTYIKVRQND